MSEETTEQTDVATDETVEAPAETTTTTTTEVVEESDDSLKGRLSEDDYNYVRKLREEAKTTRQERDEYKSAFSGFDPEGSKALLEAVKLISTDPKTAHEAFSELAEGLAEAAGITQEEAEDLIEEAQEEVVSDDDQPLTKSQLREFLASEKEAADKAAADAEAEKSFNSEIEALGYKVSSDDVNEQLDTVALLKVAKDHTNGDLTKAHEIVEARKQALVDAYLAKKDEQAASFAPSTSGTSGTNVPAKSKINSVEAARLAAMQADAE